MPATIIQRIPCVCKHCGKTRYLMPGKIADGQGVFCNKACQIAWGADPNARLWSRLVPRGECRLWSLAVNKENGYGIIGFKNKMVTTHRLAWELTNGPIPKGFQVQHTCDVNYPPGDLTYRRCCNPLHLILGSNLDNMSHASDCGRIAHGEQLPQAKLTEDNVREIKAMLNTGKLTQEEIALRYGIARSGISTIKTGDTWAHVS